MYVHIYTHIDTNTGKHIDTNTNRYTCTQTHTKHTHTDI